MGITVALSMCNKPFKPQGYPKWTSMVSWRFAEDVPTKSKKKTKNKNIKTFWVFENLLHKEEYVHIQNNYITQITQALDHIQTHCTYQDVLNPHWWHLYAIVHPTQEKYTSLTGRPSL